MNGPLFDYTVREPGTAGTEGRILHLTAFKDPMREMDKVHSLYESLMDARRSAGEPLPFLTRRITIYDGRETAPAQASSTMFLRPDGKPVPFREAVVSGRATGVPGTVAVLAMAQKEHGRLPWSALFGSARRNAQQGFAVSPRLHALLSGDAHLRKDPEAARYFYGKLVQFFDRHLKGVARP